MNKDNYSRQTPSLLLHACCAPCSTAVYEQLHANYDLTVYWYNPNIYPQAEHEKRLNEVQRLSQVLGFKLVVDERSRADHDSWRSGAIPQAKESEGGTRCHYCYHFRLRKAAEYAKQHGFDFFSTTLSVSPYKNFPGIQKIGSLSAEESGVTFLDQDYKKNNGYRRSIELSRQYGLYRQNYCGCEFSIRPQHRNGPSE